MQCLYLKHSYIAHNTVCVTMFSFHLNPQGRSSYPHCHHWLCSHQLLGRRGSQDTGDSKHESFNLSVTSISHSHFSCLHHRHAWLIFSLLINVSLFIYRLCWIFTSRMCKWSLLLWSVSYAASLSLQCNIYCQLLPTLCCAIHYHRSTCSNPLSFLPQRRIATDWDGQDSTRSVVRSGSSPLYRMQWTMPRVEFVWWALASSRHYMYRPLQINNTCLYKGQCFKPSDV